MGKGDTALSAWLADKTRFADLYNGSVFHGKQLVKAESLKQEKIHYAMPVRTMLYDSLNYVEQIRQIKKTHGRTDIVTSDEFLSGMKKEDRLCPVSTLVFYYGDKPWDGSMDLHGLLRKSGIPEIDGAMEMLIPNYHINLLDVNQIEDTSVYKTDLQTILEMLRYRQNKKNMQRYVQEHAEYFQHVDIDTYNVLRVLLKAEKQMEEIKNQEEEVDMCQALQEIFDDGKEAGRTEGRTDLLIELVRDGVLSVMQAAEKAGKSEEEFKSLMKCN